MSGTNVSKTINTKRINNNTYIISPRLFGNTIAYPRKCFTSPVSTTILSESTDYCCGVLRILITPAFP